MRKIAEKVALVAEICIAVIFVLTTLLYVLGVIPQVTNGNNAVVIVILIVLTVLFVGLCVYLLYMNFSARQNLKRILLYADSKSATTTTIKVVNKIARSCADKVEGVHVKKSKIRADEKNGYVTTFVVQVSAPSVTPVLEQLRCIVDEAFRQTLGLTFNTITFEVAKLKNEPKVDVSQAKKKAQTIVDNAGEVQDIYQNPTSESGDTVATETVLQVEDTQDDVADVALTEEVVQNDEPVFDQTADDAQTETPTDEQKQ